jgi:hypothetical protein
MPQPNGQPATEASATNGAEPDRCELANGQTLTCSGNCCPNRVLVKTDRGALLVALWSRIAMVIRSCAR